MKILNVLELIWRSLKALVLKGLLSLFRIFQLFILRISAKQNTVLASLGLTWASFYGVVQC